VRDVLDDLNGDRAPGNPAGYTTVLKLMQIMADKGLVRRDASQRTHVYEPAAGEEQTQRRLVKDLLDRVFNGSARKLVLHALSARKASPDEIAEIRALLDDMERGGKGSDAKNANAETENAKPQAPESKKGRTR
jgi:predicted transcriptional regulator